MSASAWLLVSIALIAGSFLALLGIATFIWWRVQTPDQKRLAGRIAKLRFRDKLALAAALFRDPRVSFLPGLIALALLLYLAMPIDIIPDFIPVIGYLDDLLVLAIGAGLLLRSIPPHVLEENVARLERAASQQAAAASPQPPPELTAGG